MNTFDYQAMADILRSGQIPHEHMMMIFNEHPMFALWYKKKYCNEKTAKQDKRFN